MFLHSQYDPHEGSLLTVRMARHKDKLRMRMQLSCFCFSVITRSKLTTVKMEKKGDLKK